MPMTAFEFGLLNKSAAPGWGAMLGKAVQGVGTAGAGKTFEHAGTQLLGSLGHGRGSAITNAWKSSPGLRNAAAYGLAGAGIGVAKGVASGDSLGDIARNAATGAVGGAALGGLAGKQINPYISKGRKAIGDAFKEAPATAGASTPPAPAAPAAGAAPAPGAPAPAPVPAQTPPPTPTQPGQAAPAGLPQPNQPGMMGMENDPMNKTSAYQLGYKLIKEALSAPQLMANRGQLSNYMNRTARAATNTGTAGAMRQARGAQMPANFIGQEAGNAARSAFGAGVQNIRDSGQTRAAAQAIRPPGKGTDPRIGRLNNQAATQQWQGVQQARTAMRNAAPDQLAMAANMNPQARMQAMRERASQAGLYGTSQGATTAGQPKVAPAGAPGPKAPAQPAQAPAQPQTAQGGFLDKLKPAPAGQTSPWALGALAGAGYGGYKAYTGTKDEEHKGSNAVMGALGGAALGGVGGAMAGKWGRSLMAPAPVPAPA